VSGSNKGQRACSALATRAVDFAKIGAGSMSSVAINAIAIVTEKKFNRLGINRFLQI
jgi:hypothetical protein